MSALTSGSAHVSGPPDSTTSLSNTLGFKYTADEMAIPIAEFSWFRTLSCFRKNYVCRNFMFRVRGSRMTFPKVPPMKVSGLTSMGRYSSGGSKIASATSWDAVPL